MRVATCLRGWGRVSLYFVAGSRSPGQVAACGTPARVLSALTYGLFQAHELRVGQQPRRAVPQEPPRLGRRRCPSRSRPSSARCLRSTVPGAWAYAAIGLHQ